MSDLKTLDKYDKQMKNLYTHTPGSWEQTLLTSTGNKGDILVGSSGSSGNMGITNSQYFNASSLMQSSDKTGS